MKFKEHLFDELPFTDLFKTYLHSYETLAEFYTGNPFDEDEVASKAEEFRFTGDRDATVEALKAYNNRFDIDPAAKKNIDRLEEDHALTLVTGQQLGVLGGPLYTILKTVSVLHLAESLETKLDRPVIPVFWLADEDHDYREVNGISLPVSDKLERIELDLESKGHPPVSEVELPEKYESFRNAVKEKLHDTDFSGELWALLDACYRPGERLDLAFGNLLTTLFSGRGLVLAGSNHPHIKKIVGGAMQHSIEKADLLNEKLEKVSSRVGERFHQQATVTDTHLFYLDGGGRSKIQRNGSRWFTNNGTEWSADELMNAIRDKPEQFSPNVFLRPIIQDLLLPTFGYVAGPAELAYYAQIQSAYEEFGLSMPFIFPRLSATIIEPSIARILEEVPFEIPEYQQRIEDLESAYVEQAEQADIEKIFNEWKQRIEETAGQFTARIIDIDPTLEGASGKATASYHNELDRLKGKVYRAVKQKEKIQLNRIRKIKSQLFPGGELQERVIPFIYFMNKYGVRIWEELLDELEEDDRFQSHKWIYL